MTQGDVDLEGITFRSEEEQAKFIAGQRERAIGARAEQADHPVAAKEAYGQARKLLYGAAKARERARLRLNKIAKPSR